MSEEKTEVQLLQEKLMMNKKHAAKVIDDAEMAKVMEFAEGYKKFLNDNKTEREVAAFIVEEAKKKALLSLINSVNTSRAIRFTTLTAKRLLFLP